MLFVCASAALTALGLSAYLYTEIDSIARRLDEQATRLADLDHSTATQTTAKPPTVSFISYFVRYFWGLSRCQILASNLLVYPQMRYQQMHSIISCCFYCCRMTVHQILTVTVHKASDTGSSQLWRHVIEIVNLHVATWTFVLMLNRQGTAGYRNVLGIVAVLVSIRICFS